MDGFDTLLDNATDAVNAAPKDSHAEGHAKAYRRGLIDAANALGHDWDAFGQDLRQLAMGHDRLMCCGIWLDKGEARDATDWHPLDRYPIPRAPEARP